MENNEINVSLEGLIADINDEVAVLASASALLYHSLKDVNWVGFYLLKNKQLILGPFQGKPACVYIKLGKGACGSCAVSKKTIILEDVTKVENYIACHEETRSEIVIPILINDELYGVLDIDSTKVNRFTNNDQIRLEESAQIISNKLLEVI